MAEERVLAFEWNESKILDSEVEFLMKEENYSQEEAQRIVQRGDIAQWAWEDFLYQVQLWLEENTTLNFYVEAYNVGWMNGSGHTSFSVNPDTDGALTFIRKVVGFDLGNPFTLQAYAHDIPNTHYKKLHINVYHHDSPMGEGRDVYPAHPCEECGTGMINEAYLVRIIGHINEGSHLIMCKECVDDLLAYKEIEIIDKLSAERLLNHSSTRMARKAHISTKKGEYNPEIQKAMLKANDIAESAGAYKEAELTGEEDLDVYMLNETYLDDLEQRSVRNYYRERIDELYWNE